MKKLPYGVSDYEKIIEKNYYYVDKTQYIEKLEDLAETSIMFLRPRKFGKTLFTSVLENYYDVNKKEKFEELFGETYIGKNPTEMKNSYYILRFNFSGINTKDEETTMEGFKGKVTDSIQKFVNRYELDFYINPELSTEGLLNSLIVAFENQKQNEKMYVIIDEYDHFANELLGFQTESFKNLVSKNGRVRKFYEILKEGTESVVDRIFITGVAPITLDSMTSGFNILTDLTQDRTFNEMMGFTEEEIIEIMEEQGIEKEKQEELLPLMKENYDGYRFSIDITENRNLYNSNMCLYFLNSYISFGKIPEELVDVNIVSDYNNVLLCLLIFLSFTVGLVLAYLISYLLKKINKEKYSKLVLLIIIFILIIPNYFFGQTTNLDLSYLAVFMLSIIGGILLESFRTSYVSYTSTMMTNNYKLFVHSLLTRVLLKEKGEGRKSVMYLFIIISFLLGVLSYTLFYKYNIIRQQIIFVPHLFILVLIVLEYLDIKKDGVIYEK